MHGRRGATVFIRKGRRLDRSMIEWPDSGGGRLHRKDHLYMTPLLWLRLLVIAASVAAVALPEPVRLIAQSQGDAATQKFEVASVKVNKSGSAARGVSLQPGRLIVNDLTLREIVEPT
jgi:hypothetical protein